MRRNCALRGAKSSVRGGLEPAPRAASCAGTMSLSPSGRPRERLHVIAMALALAVAALAGGVLGIVWHKIAGDEKAADGASAGPPD